MITRVFFPAHAQLPDNLKRLATPKKLCRKECQEVSFRGEAWFTHYGLAILYVEGLRRRVELKVGNVAAIRLDKQKTLYNRFYCKTCGELDGKVVYRTKEMSLIRCSRCKREWHWVEPVRVLERQEQEKETEGELAIINV